MSESEKGLELVVEIGCEELPADWVTPATDSFETNWNVQLADFDLLHLRHSVHCYATPRRLVAHAKRVLERQADDIAPTLGPPAKIGWNNDMWTPAALGFARRLGLEGAEAEAALEIVDTPRGPYVGARPPRQAAMDVMPVILEKVLRLTQFPTTMHWDATISGKPLPFGRPIRWIVALLDGEVIPFTIEVEGGEPVVADKYSYGHRFRAKEGKPGVRFAVDSFHSLNEGLAQRFVVLKPDDRKRKLWEVLERAAKGVPQQDQTFVPTDEHQMVECPGAVLGTYDPEFLVLPEEVREAVLVHHQKYLPLGKRGAFLVVMNMPDDPGEAIRRGAERVVRARLRDAAFFWNDALIRPLEERRGGLAQVMFHRRIGDLRKHGERVERLAGWVAERVGADVEAAKRAALLAKCDLATSLVGEFPSLQGIAGGRILEAQGEPEKVWKAVLDHYRGSGVFGDLPETIEGAAVALADRASTLVGLFVCGEEPSGSRDPFGLRRATLGMLAILRNPPRAFVGSHENGRKSDWPAPVDLLQQALSESAYDILSPEDRDAMWDRLVAFVTDRLLHALVPAGTSPGAARAVLTVRGIEHSVVDCGKRIRALEGWVGREEYASLAAAHKRARRILPAELRSGERPEVNSELFAESAERALFEELKSAATKVDEFSRSGDYDDALWALAQLAPKVDAFFDEVLVMAEDADVRANRLALLSQLDALFSEVGDLGQIGAGPDDITPKQ